MSKNADDNRKYDGTEKLCGKKTLFTKDGDTKCSIQEFWAWSSSDLVDNTLRGVFAEYIVATALGIDLNVPRDNWLEYDLKYKGYNIEIKTSGYVQAWHRKPKEAKQIIDETKIHTDDLNSDTKKQKISTLRFGVGKTRKFDRNIGSYEAVARRHAEVYVFCIQTCKEIENVNILDIDQWRFYVLRKDVFINEYENTESIGIETLKRLYFGQKTTRKGLEDALTYAQLKIALDKALGLS